jgi:hypothetical protein
MFIDLGEAVGGHRTGGEDSRRWFEILTTLCVVSVVLGTGGLFEHDFIDGRCIRNASDTQQVGVITFRQDIYERLKNAWFY